MMGSALQHLRLSLTELSEGLRTRTEIVHRPCDAGTHQAAQRHPEHCYLPSFAMHTASLHSMLGVAPSGAVPQSPRRLAATVNTNLLQLLATLYGQAATISALQANSDTAPCAHTQAHQALSQGIASAIKLTTDALSDYQTLVAADPNLPSSPPLPPDKLSASSGRGANPEDDVVSRLELESHQLRLRLAAAQARTRNFPMLLDGRASLDTSAPDGRHKSRKRIRMEESDSSEGDSIPASSPSTRQAKLVFSSQFGDPPLSRKRHAMSARFAGYACTSRARVHDGYLAIDAPNTTVLAHTLVPPRLMPAATMDAYVSAMVGVTANATDRMKDVLSIIAAVSPLESVSASTIADRFTGPKSDRHGLLTCAMRWAMRPMVTAQELDVNGAYRAVWEQLVAQLTADERDLVQHSTLVLAVGVEMDHYPDGLFADCQDFDAQATMFRIRERIALVHLHQPALTSVAARLPLPDPALLSLDDDMSHRPRPLARHGRLPPRTTRLQWNQEDAMDTGSQSDDEADDEEGIERPEQIFAPKPPLQPVRCPPALDSHESGQQESSQANDDMTQPKQTAPALPTRVAPFEPAVLFSTLPLLQGSNPAPSRTFALPTSLAERVARRADWTRGRFADGLLQAHQKHQRLLSHQLVPPRPLDGTARTQYLATLKSQRQLHKYAPVVIETLLQHGLGVYVAHQELLSQISTTLKAKANDSLSFAIVRPVYVVSSVDRDTRPDLWNALVALVDPAVCVPDTAQLALTIAVECLGLEEPTAETEVPQREMRKYALRERIGIVVKDVEAKKSAKASQKRTSRLGSPNDRTSEDGIEDNGDDDAEAEVSLRTDSNQIRAVAGPSTTQRFQPHPRAQLAFPATLAPDAPNRRIQRFVSGRLQVSDASIVLADQLAPPRPLPIDEYIALTHQEVTGTVTREIFAYAITRGPGRPFAKLDLASAIGGLCDAHRSRTLLRALVYCMIRPLFVVNGVLDRGQYAQVYEELVPEAIARGTVADAPSIPKEARLVRLLGLEMCGFEYPHAEDALPAWEDRRFVIRERYALVV